jgi:hypothetical protein
MAEDVRSRRSSQCFRGSHLALRVRFPAEDPGEGLSVGPDGLVDVIGTVRSSRPPNFSRTWARLRTSFIIWAAGVDPDQSAREFFLVGI